MVLGRIKRWFGLDDLTEYERETLEDEYRRLESKIDRVDRELEQVHCAGCAKKENPQAQRLIAKKREHEKRQDEIEKRLGEAPATTGTASRRRSKRVRA